MFAEDVYTGIRNDTAIKQLPGSVLSTPIFPIICVYLYFLLSVES